MSIDGQNAGNQSKFRNLRLLRIFFTLSIGVIAVGFGFRYYMLSAEQQTKISQLESAMQSLKGAMQVDTARQYNIQKIIVIIDRFNSGMSSPEKYEIANEIYEMSLKYTNLNIDLI
ncbi:hypothetical protein L0244_35805, partial [bacterium]|nr:hypothetical protein [bacterium]